MGLLKEDGTIGFWPSWVAPAPASLRKEIEALKASKNAGEKAKRKSPAKPARSVGTR